MYLSWVTKKGSVPVVAVSIAMSSNNAFSKNVMDLNFDDISLLTCGLCHILARSAEVNCKKQKCMRNGL